MNQSYHKYTAADHVMWRRLFERQMAQLPPIASRAYLEGMEKVGFGADHIPDFEAETNPRLRALTGWSVEVVPGLIPQRDFFELMARRRFPASTWLRAPEQLDYLEEPDMFHDTFGHVPLLTNQAFCDFMSDLSRVALRFIDQPEAIVQIGRLYWYTVEFGLIREEGQTKIYGGGILSSAGESAYCLSDAVPKFPFDVRTVLNTFYHIDRYQDRYFVIDSYEQLYRSVPDIEEILAETHLISG
ncbi:phenylalanine 4-monooxygenase [Runella slithyformis]|uniref:phenylalanine 4-monooxygenase n=1 Tax=Runella slithyformis (strain ATCC 29530 / DSM 19594 / LMG 11500 / NCIMB 11436 / LSU 4) TaxID=761193 RepID=A0A7U3ZQC7_RUNSL|nr:phenylalanine 4-monooxygenase [Runella slithyformis]AEI51427.1 Phenylalanine 4-monooxygenase [Runella slithyformis DSM 19594]